MDSMGSIDQPSCGICFDDLDIHEKPLSTLPCGHAFGRSCVSQWFEAQKPQIPTCPMCRQDARSLKQRFVEFISTPHMKAMGIGGGVGAMSTMLTAKIAGGSIGTVAKLGGLSFAGAVVSIHKKSFLSITVIATSAFLAESKGIFSVGAGMVAAITGKSIFDRSIQNHLVCQAVVLGSVDLIYLARSVIYDL